MSKIKWLALIFIAVTASVWAGTGTITVTSPRTGDVLCRGRAYPIRWTSSGVGDRVRVQIIRSSGVATYLAMDTKNSGLFDYTVPATISEGNYTVAVMSLDGRVRGESGIFRIDLCTLTPVPPTPMEIMPRINVTYPYTGRIQYVSELFGVRWTTTGRVPDRLMILLYPADCSDHHHSIILLTETPNDGHASVYTPPNVTPGIYTIRVAEFGNPIHGIFGCSQPFEIRLEYSVYEPIRSSSCHQGDSIVVRWRSAVPGGDPVDIGIFQDREWEIGTIRGPCLARGTANDGEARVTIPVDLTPGWYRICLRPNLCYGRSYIISADGGTSGSFQVLAR